VGSPDSALSSLPQPLLNFEWFDCQRGLAAEARNHFLVQNPLVSLRSCISLLDGCLRLVFLQLVNVMLTELPIRRWIPSEGLILVSVFPETLPIDFLPGILLARPGQIIARGVQIDCSKGASIRRRNSAAKLYCAPTRLPEQSAAATRSAPQPG
jgi:hypothetical protein